MLTVSVDLGMREVAIANAVEMYRVLRRVRDEWEAEKIDLPPSLGIAVVNVTSTVEAGKRHVSR